MKTLLVVLLLLLPAFASAQGMPPPPGGWCLDNCGAFPGDCGACHNTQGPAVYIADGFSYCQGCGGLTSAVRRPQVPMQPRADTLLAWVKGLAAGPDVKYLRIAAMTPERHVALMQRAVRLHLDGAVLGACSKAFKPGTLDLLPREIADTRMRLGLALVRP